MLQSRDISVKQVARRTIVIRKDVIAVLIENTLAGSDVNPYLVIAASLACGYLGMAEGLKPTAEAEGSAHSGAFDLHRHIYAAIDAMEKSDAMRSMLGDEFVTLYTVLKDAEYSAFQEIITPYERQTLMLNV